MEVSPVSQYSEDMVKQAIEQVNDALRSLSLAEDSLESAIRESGGSEMPKELVQIALKVYRRRIALELEIKEPLTTWCGITRFNKMGPWK